MLKKLSTYFWSLSAGYGKKEDSKQGSAVWTALAGFEGPCF